MTDMAQRASVEERRAHLETLTGKLATFDRDPSVSRTGVPMLIVTNPEIPALSEHVLCCHDVDGTLAYFWPWGQRIADVGNPCTAAYAVARVLSAR